MASVFFDSQMDAIVNKVQISKAIWHPKTIQLEMAGSITWKAGSSRVLRANALTGQLQVLNGASQALIATGQANLTGSWKIVVNLSAGVLPPKQLQAQFRGKYSVIRIVK